MSSMHVVYARELPPQRFSKSIFLTGPSHAAWQLQALKMLEELAYDGVVFVPIPRDGTSEYDHDFPVEWEAAHVNMSDVVVFWLPHDTKDVASRITHIEFGMLYDSGKAILGYPEEDTPHMGYMMHQACYEHIPVYFTLEKTLAAAVTRIQPGVERIGGERMIPLHLWQLPHFQGWFKAQKEAGNRLDGARLLWSFRVGSMKNFTFAYALHVDMYSAAEKRNKTNEFVFARPDISTVVAYCRRAELKDTEVVLIREFRSPARTIDGFIREVPGGSSWKPDEDPFSTAAHELNEETGFQIDASRLRKIGVRQLCGTLSVHQAHVFACEITEEELEVLRQQEAQGVVHGVLKDTERTSIEVHALHDLLDPASQAVDWSMLGMILSAIGI